jgi:cell wall-associated NlpC family hydrolase
MHYGICLLSVIPCRKEPSSTSEMVTQLLFGEHYSVIENGEDWIKISTAYDNYECYISAKQHQKISENTVKELEKQEPVYASGLVSIATDKMKQLSFPLTIGARLPFLKEGKMSFENFVFSYDGEVAKGREKKPAKEIIATAMMLLNAPYLWGGKSPFGIDCSGFTQLIYKLNGYTLPRDASQQVEKGNPLNFVEEAEAGDLAFFDNEEGRIVHVGIIIDHEHIIHASGQVRIDRFDHYGIHNTDIKKYSHTLRVIKRVI